MAPNRHNSLLCTVWTSRQRSCNQSVSFLLCSMARIYELWVGSLTSVRYVVWSLVAVSMTYEFKYRNTPYIHTETYHIRMFLVTRYALALIRSLLTKKHVFKFFLRLTILIPARFNLTFLF